jgi:hypothetical protein
MTAAINQNAQVTTKSNQKKVVRTILFILAVVAFVYVLVHPFWYYPALVNLFGYEGPQRE